MFVLVLNDMRMADIEHVQPVARSESREALDAFLRAEQVQGYTDGVWEKVFRKDGPLEWFTPPCITVQEYIKDAGTEENWVERTRREYQERVMSLPCV